MSLGLMNPDITFESLDTLMASENVSNASNPLVWLFGVLAIGSATMFGVSRQADRPQPEKTTAESPKKESESKAPAEHETTERLDILNDYLRVTAEKPDEASTFRIKLAQQSKNSSLSISIDTKQVTRTNDIFLSDALQIEPAKYEFLIATVPDPVESKFPNEFDSVVDGIQRAFEYRGFEFRTSRLLWPHGQNRNGENMDSHSNSPYRDHPGMMLFEKRLKPSQEPGQDESLTFALVCLVGESPISGIHKPSFTAALSARDTLDDAITEAKKKFDIIGWANNGSTIRLVAPYFSGSQSSLLVALKQWKLKAKENRPQLRIINGSATALAPDLFGRQTIAPSDPESMEGLDNQEFLGSTVIPNRLLTHGVFSYLTGNRSVSMHPDDTGKHKITQRVAILRETNTGFGGNYESAKFRIETDTSLMPFEQYLSDAPTQVIDLPFPMAIYRLQAEQERNGKPAVALPQTGFVEPKQSNFNRIDAIPPYDPESSTSSAGQSLRTILSVISRADVRYVGIVATDQRDVVFLNRLLRKECPHVRVFSTEPSIALIHPDEAYHLRGMLVGSTYPLAPITQYWGRTSNSQHSMISFPTQGSQGYFNAILAQFERDDLMLGYRPPLILGTDNPGVRPPIWISIVGHSGQLIPVHCYTDYASDPNKDTLVYRMNVSPAINITQQLPLVGAPIGLVIASLGAVVAMSLVIVTLTSKWAWREWAAGATPEEEKGADSSTAETSADRSVDTRMKQGFLDNPWLWVWFWRAVMLAGILLFILPYTFPALEMWGPCSWGPSWRHKAILLFAIVLICEILAILVLLGLRSAGILEAHLGEYRLGCVALKAMVLVSGLWTLIWWCVLNTPVERLFLYVRATELTAGVSVVIPMGLLGAALFALGWFCLRQAGLSRYCQLKCPYPCLWTNVRQADNALKADLVNHFRFMSNRRNLFVLFGFGFFFLLSFAWNLWIIPLPSGEGSTWDVLMKLVFSGAGVAVVLVLIRFLELWSRLRQLLKAILQVPMVGAFELLPDEISQRFGGYLYAERKTYNSQLWAAAWALPLQERNKLFKWINHPNKVGPSWMFGETDSISPAESSAAGVHNPRDREVFRHQLQHYAEMYLLELAPQWPNHSIDEALGVAHPRNRDEKSAPPQQSAQDDNLKPQEPSVGEKESYVAAFIVLYLSGYFAQLRMLACAMATAAPLILCAAASYTFQPPQPLLAVFIGLLAAVAIALAYVLYRINKNRLVSRIMGTTPNRFSPDWGFLSSITTYVVPLVALVLLHVLGLFRFIVEPILSLFQ